MRTVQTYPLAQQNQQQQQQQQHQQEQQDQQPSLLSATVSTNQTNLHQHSSTSGYPSVRHSLLRMHSQLRTAPNSRESTQGPIDLSIYRVARPTPKLNLRVTSTNATTVRTNTTVTRLAMPPTHTSYSNATPSSSSSFSSSATLSKTAISNSNHENSTKMRSSFPSDVIPKSSCSSNAHPPPSTSPKLAYAFSNIEENLQCPLCIDRLRDPRALPCQHVFCCSCLKSIPSSNLPYPTIVCPLCRRTFPYNGADQFPVSYIHRQLLELVPKNYDINGKCTKCQEKTSLKLCSCCDFLLCDKCSKNDRDKIIDNIHHIVETCYYRLKRIDTTCKQLDELNDMNRKKIYQIESMFASFERKFFEHKQSILSSLNKYNEKISSQFWSKLNMPSQNTTQSINDLLEKAQFMVQSQSIKFDDILSLFYNLNSINEQLEQADTLIDTFDVQNLLKQRIEINNNNNQLDDQINVQLNLLDSQEKILPLLPSTLLSRSTKRLRKSEPKRHIEEVNNDGDNNANNDESLPILKQLKVECHNDLNFDSLSSPTSSIFCLNFPDDQQQQNQHQDELHNNDDDDDDDDDRDIIYIETVPAKSPVTFNFEELFQMIGTNE